MKTVQILYFGFPRTNLFKIQEKSIHEIKLLLPTLRTLVKNKYTNDQF